MIDTRVELYAVAQPEGARAPLKPHNKFLQTMKNLSAYQKMKNSTVVETHQGTKIRGAVTVDAEEDTDID